MLAARSKSMWEVTRRKLLPVGFSGVLGFNETLVTGEPQNTRSSI